MNRDYRSARVFPLFRLLSVTILIFVFSCIHVRLMAQDGILDPAFNPADQVAQAAEGVNGPILSVLVQPDGKILMGGDYTSYQGESTAFISRLLPDGRIDPDFQNQSPLVQSEVRKIMLQPDGKILVAGAFGITRLLANGQQDPGFNPGGAGANNAVNDIILQSTGHILAGGAFTAYNGDPVGYLMRLMPTGTRDVAFNGNQSGPNDEVKTMALQPNMRFIIGGRFTLYNQNPVNQLVRLSTNGSFDAFFQAAAIPFQGAVNKIALQADGRLLVADGGDEGLFLVSKLYRLNANGSRDAGFLENSATQLVQGRINQILIQPDQKILIGSGSREEQNDIYSGGPGNQLFRLQSNGSFDSSFLYSVEYVKEYVFALALQSNGQILVARNLDPNLYRDPISRLYAKGLRNTGLIRIGSNGLEDLRFSIPANATGFNKPVEDFVQQPDGRYLVAGSFSSYRGEAAPYLIRLLEDGTRDTSFQMTGNGLNNTVKSIQLLPDGKILLSGYFVRYHDLRVPAVIRLFPDGSLDSSFRYGGNNGGYSDFIEKILVTDTASILALRTVEQPDAIIRLQTDGSLDNNFMANISIDLPFSLTQLRDMVRQPDGKILVAGFFVKVGQLFESGITRLLPDGSRDPEFNPIPLNSFQGVGADAVNSIALQPDGKILIGGSFTEHRSFYQTLSLPRLARLFANGLPDTSFNSQGSGFNRSVQKIVLQDDGRILVSGSFNNYNGLPVPGLIRLLPDGQADPGFNPGGSGPAGLITTLLPVTGRRLLIGGDFQTYNGIGKNRMARLTLCSVPVDTVHASICSAQLPFLWNGQSLDSSGIYTATLLNPEGCDSTVVLKLTVTANGAGAIQGPQRVCAFIGPNAPIAYYTIEFTNTATITWSVSQTATMQIVSGQGTGRLGIRFSDAFTTGAVYARVSSASCGSVRRSLALNRSKPSTPAAISSSEPNLCPVIEAANGGTFIPVYLQIRKVSGATGYVWTSQSATTLLLHPNGAGPEDTLVQLFITDPFAFSTSAVTVQAINDCGMSSVRSLTLTRAVPAAPVFVSAPVDVCSHLEPNGLPVIYSVQAQPEVNYIWTLPSGITRLNGQFTEEVSFLYPSGFTTGTVQVNGYNGCGTGAARTLNVRAFAVSTPGSITATVLSDCPNRVIRYSIAAAPAYADSLIWTVPAQGQIISGQGTLSVQVAFTGAVSGSVSVQAFNECSSSSVRKLSVNYPACTPVFAVTQAVEQRASFFTEPMQSLSAQVYPNPAIREFNLKVSSARSSLIQCRVWDAMGRLVEVFTATVGIAKPWGAQLKPGTYWLEIRQDHDVIRLQAVK